MANKREGKLWIYLDAGFPDDAKVVAAGEKAGWLYVVMLCAAKRLDTDGVMTTGQIARLSVPGWKRRLDDLIRADLVVELPLSPGHYAIASWERWQETVAEREERREAWRNSKRKPKAQKEADAHV